MTSYVALPVGRPAVSTPCSVSVGAGVPPAKRLTVLLGDIHAPNCMLFKRSAFMPVDVWLVQQAIILPPLSSGCIGWLLGRTRAEVLEEGIISVLYVPKS